MSDRQQRLRKQQANRRTREQHRAQTIKASLKIQGCTCGHVNVKHTGPSRAQIQHDPDCPMLGRGPSIIIDLRRTPGCGR